MKKTFTLLLTALLFIVGANGQTTNLKAGDIALIGFNFDTDDSFGFLALEDLEAGTEIVFTDNGWLSAGSFRTGEGTETWTASSAIAKGTVVIFDSSLGLSGSGDQIIAFQGTLQSPTIIYALNSDGTTGWQADATSSNTSALPQGLIDGSTAIALSEVDNAYYHGNTSGTKEDLLLAISNKNNWTGSNSYQGTANWASAFSIVESGSPVISTTSNSLTEFTYEVGNGASASQTISVSGSNLESDITVSAPTNFQVALTDQEASYGSSITTPSTGAATTVYIRLASGLSVNTYNGDLTLSSTNASSKTVSLSGEVTAPVVPATLPVSESFDGGTEPQDWTLTDFVVSSTDNAGGSSSELKLDYSNDNAGSSSVLTKPINTTGETSLTLTWKQKVDFYEGGTGTDYTIKVQWSTDGSTWGDVWTQVVDADEVALKQAVLTASEGVGSGNLLLRWIYAENNTNRFSYWYIDDIVLDLTPEDPTISVSPSSLSNLDYTVGEGPSTEQSFSVSGLSLQADITVSAPTNFEVSLDNVTYASSVTTPQSGASTTVYVRLAAGLSANTYSGDITLTSTNADAKTVSLSGEVKEVVATPTAWINEIHYDNDGGDVNEMVEIVVKSDGGFNYDVADFAITLYNGGNQESYSTKAGSSWGFVNGGTDYRFYTCDVTGIQNGGPDGVALSYNGALIQFLSYEGSFTAANGVASGQTSEDIGVAETSTTPVGQSLQLIGNGTEYADFTWSGPITATAGWINTGQNFTSGTWTTSQSIKSESKIYGGNNNIVIRSEEVANFTVYNLTGKVVKAGTISAGETFVNVKSGIYIVKLNSSTHKVLVK